MTPQNIAIGAVSPAKWLIINQNLFIMFTIEQVQTYKLAGQSGVFTQPEQVEAIISNALDNNEIVSVTLKGFILYMGYKTHKDNNQLPQTIRTAEQEQLLTIEQKSLYSKFPVLDLQGNEFIGIVRKIDLALVKGLRTFNCKVVKFNDYKNLQFTETAASPVTAAVNIADYTIEQYNDYVTACNNAKVTPIAIGEFMKTKV